MAGEGHAGRLQCRRRPDLELGRHEDQWHTSEQLAGIDQGRSPLRAVIACRLMAGHRSGHRPVEGHVAADRSRQTVAQRAAVAPQQIGADDITQPVPEPEQLLVGVVGLDPQLVCDLRRGQPVAEVQIEQADLPLAQRGRGSPHQLLAIPYLADRIGSQGSLGPGGVRETSVSKTTHHIIPGGPAAVLPLQTVERPVPGDSQQPSAEGVGIVELIQPLPGRQHRILRDVGRQIVVADDRSGNVPRAVEPSVEQFAERLAVLGPSGQDQLRVGSLATLHHIPPR